MLLERKSANKLATFYCNKATMRAYLQFFRQNLVFAVAIGQAKFSRASGISERSEDRELQTLAVTKKL